MSSHLEPFDSTCSGTVTAFSEAIRNALASYPVSANIAYVILHFYADAQMEQIKKEAAARLEHRTASWVSNEEDESQ